MADDIEWHRECVRRRDEAFLSLDRAKIEAYMRAYGLNVPDDEDVFWMSVHKARVMCTTLPEAARDESRAWLHARGSGASADPNCWCFEHRTDGSERYVVHEALRTYGGTVADTKCGLVHRAFVAVCAENWRSKFSGGDSIARVLKLLRAEGLKDLRAVRCMACAGIGGS